MNKFETNTQVIATSRCYDRQVGTIRDTKEQYGETVYLVDFGDKEVWLVGDILTAK